MKTLSRTNYCPSVDVHHRFIQRFAEELESVVRRHDNGVKVADDKMRRWFRFLLKLDLYKNALVEAIDELAGSAKENVWFQRMAELAHQIHQ